MWLKCYSPVNRQIDKLSEAIEIVVVLQWNVYRKKYEKYNNQYYYIYKTDLCISLIYNIAWNALEGYVCTPSYLHHTKQETNDNKYLMVYYQMR